MENHQQGDRLSWGDTVFLNLEREGMPLNVASVCILEGEVAFEDLLQFVESKLPLLPRYLQRVVASPLNIGLPSWEFDPTFDLRNHVRETRLKHGTDVELKALAGKLFSNVMDRQHPLWDITLVRGLKGNRTGLIARLHHALADGIAGVGIMKVLFDVSPEASPLPRIKLELPTPPPRDPLTSLVSGIVDSYGDFVKRTLAAMTDVMAMGERASAAASASTLASNGNANGNGNGVPADDFSRYLPELTAFTERLRFNVPYRGPQKFAWAEISLAQVKEIRKACGTSVNDVVLELMTSTIRRYAELHGDKVKGKLLRMMVPVNLRGGESPAELGNRISLVPVTIPLDIKDPKKLLAAAHARTEFIKRTHAAELVSLAGGMIGMFPTSLQALVGPFVSRLPITPFNLVCTNVPGPQFPLYLRGHKMLSWYPYVPVGGEMAMNCAILSYNGVMYFGFSGDVHAAPDLRRLETLLKDSFRELREAALAGPPRKTKKSPTKPRARAKAESKSRPAVPAKPAVSAVAAAGVAGEEKADSSMEGEEITAQLIA